MKKLSSLIIIGVLIMGLFSFTKKASGSETQSSAAILGMILLEEPDSIVKIKDIVKELREKWKLEVDDSNAGEQTSVLVIQGYHVAIATLPVAIPGDEIKSAAAYNYLWENAEAEATQHKGHIILSITNAGKDPVKENMLFTKVAASVLNNTRSLGIYMGGRTLVLKKDFYLANTATMTDDDLPLFNWIYFGMRKENGGQSLYTYGLADFNKPEMEMINSKRPFDELADMMFNLVHYVLASDVTLKDGETIGMSAEQKLKITLSKGKYLDGKTLKIQY